MDKSAAGNTAASCQVIDQSFIDDEKGLCLKK
jgi:hypothetical protein